MKAPVPAPAAATPAPIPPPTTPTPAVPAPPIVQPQPPLLPAPAPAATPTPPALVASPVPATAEHPTCAPPPAAKGTRKPKVPKTPSAVPVLPPGTPTSAEAQKLATASTVAMQRYFKYGAAAFAPGVDFATLRVWPNGLPEEPTPEKMVNATPLQVLTYAITSVAWARECGGQAIQPIPLVGRHTRFVKEITTQKGPETTCELIDLIMNQWAEVGRIARTPHWPEWPDVAYLLTENTMNAAIKVGENCS